MTIYPVHTPVSEISHFNRGTKVQFECMDHEGSRWVSKDPYVSQWFARWDNSDAFGSPLKNCDCKANKMWTIEEYDDGLTD